MIRAGLVAQAAVDARACSPRPGSRPRSRPARAPSPPISSAPDCWRRWRRSASTSSATAAPPAPASRGRSSPWPPMPSSRSGRAVAAVLSGNRNFDGRIHRLVGASYLCSPALVVAFALAGRVTIDIDQRSRSRTTRPARRFSCATSGPTMRRSMRVVRAGGDAGRVRQHRASQARWCRRAGTRIAAPRGVLFDWDAASSYIVEPPFFAAAAAGLCDARSASPARACSASLATTSPPTTSRRAARFPPTARPDTICSRSAFRPRLQQLCGPARQSSRDDARHLRQPAHPQPHGRRPRGLVDEALSRRRDRHGVRRRGALSRSATFR